MSVFSKNNRRNPSLAIIGLMFHYLVAVPELFAQGDVVRVSHAIPEFSAVISSPSEDAIVTSVIGGVLLQQLSDVRISTVSPYPLRSLLGRDVELVSNGIVSNPGRQTLGQSQGEIIRLDFFPQTSVSLVSPEPVGTPEESMPFGFTQLSFGRVESGGLHLGDTNTLPAETRLRRIPNDFEFDILAPLLQTSGVGAAIEGDGGGTFLGGAVNISYRYAETATESTPIQIVLGSDSQENPEPFDDNLRNIPLPRESVVPQANSLDGISIIGTIEDLTGSVRVQRVDGTTVQAMVGTPIYAGDIIDSEGNGTAEILFIDESTYRTPSNNTVLIDEFVFGLNDSVSDPPAGLSLLQKVFIGVSGLIEREGEGEGGLPIPQGGGIRGFEFTDPDEEDLGSRSIVREGIAIRRKSSASGSEEEAEIYTSVEIPENPFTIEFDIALVDAGSELEVFLGTVPVARFDSSNTAVGELQRAEILIDDPTLLSLENAELLLRLSSETNAPLVIDNIFVGDSARAIDLVGFSAAFYARGNSEVFPAFFLAVPEPSSAVLLMIVAGYAARRMRRV